MNNPFKRRKKVYLSCYAYQLSVLKEHNLSVIEEHYGPRCKTTDLDDFPDLFGMNTLWGGRCPVCLVYEKFDAYWKTLI